MQSSLPPELVAELELLADLIQLEQAQALARRLQAQHEARKHRDAEQTLER